eukprot:TRINITY_DN57481_c0_g1_i1.p1 TRINITY_DN57481_c0_g1~~TRINITY_DN57481_c0_g1_i1.p1  ORF type:complete len:235 (-),score=18.79 TRINITY_DN57481_c0_g1_i1:61-684(-)
MSSIIWEGKKLTWWRIAEGVELEPVHIFALFAYTANSDICYATNKAMREHNPVEISRWRPVIYHVWSALKALPCIGSSHTTVPSPVGLRMLRGVRMPIDARVLQVGRELCWSAFSSTSLDPKVAVAFVDGTKGVVWDIRNAGACGRLIAPFSQFPLEEEVVLPPNTKLRIESIHPADWLSLFLGDDVRKLQIRGDEDVVAIVATVVE